MSVPGPVSDRATFLTPSVSEPPKVVVADWWTVKIDSADPLLVIAPAEPLRVMTVGL